MTAFILKCVSVSHQSNLQSYYVTTTAKNIDFSESKNVCVIRFNPLLICKIEIADLLTSWINYTALQIKV